MVKKFFLILLGIGIVTLLLGTPPAHAVFGIRAARTVMAARKAKKLASSSETNEASPQVNEKVRGAEEQEDSKNVTQ